MEIQFADEPLDKKPNLYKLYNCSTDTKSTGFTHLMKLVLQGKHVAKEESLLYDLITSNVNDINEQNDAGWTALMIACRNSNTYSSIEIVSLFLDHPDIDINKQENDEWTA